MNMHIKSDCQDEGFASAPEHQAALAAQDAKRAMQTLMKMSEDARYRDALIPVLDDLYLVRVAISVVTGRVEARDAA